MQEKSVEYIIPDNFIKKGYILNGALKIRHVIEAAIICGPLGFLLWKVPISNLSAKVLFMCGLIAFPLFISLMGVNGDSFFEFIKLAWKWKKQREIMLYNGTPRILRKRAVEITFNEVNPVDMVYGAIDKMKEAAEQKRRGKVYIEGENFVFKDDYELKRIEELVKKEEKRNKKETSSTAPKKENANKVKAAPKKSPTSTHNESNNQEMPLKILDEFDNRDLRIVDGDKAFESEVLECEVLPSEAFESEVLECEVLPSEAFESEVLECEVLTSEAFESEVLECEVLEETPESECYLLEEDEYDYK